MKRFVMLLFLTTFFTLGIKPGMSNKDAKIVEVGSLAVAQSNYCHRRYKPFLIFCCKFTNNQNDCCSLNRQCGGGNEN